MNLQEGELPAQLQNYTDSSFQ